MILVGQTPVTRERRLAVVSESPDREYGLQCGGHTVAKATVVTDCRDDQDVSFVAQVYDTIELLVSLPSLSADLR